MVLGFRVSYYGGDSTSSAGSYRAPMCPCSACWEGLPHGTKAMNSWRKKKQQKQTDSPSSSTSSLASTISEKSSSSSSSSNKKKTLAGRLTRRPSTESFASDMVPLRGAMSFQSNADSLSSEKNSFLDEKI